MTGRPPRRAEYPADLRYRLRQIEAIMPSAGRREERLPCPSRWCPADRRRGRAPVQDWGCPRCAGRRVYCDLPRSSTIRVAAPGKRSAASSIEQGDGQRWVEATAPRRITARARGQIRESPRRDRTGGPLEEGWPSGSASAGGSATRSGCRRARGARSCGAPRNVAAAVDPRPRDLRDPAVDRVVRDAYPAPG